MSTRRLHPGAYAQDSEGPRPLGPNGRPTCRFCGGEIPPGGRRRTFCSAACSYEWNVRTSATFARHEVRKRDRGICALCGIDTRVLHEALQKLEHDYGDYRRRQWLLKGRKQLNVFQQFIRDNQLGGWKAKWHMDHIIPVCEGGGECGLENLRTLCVRCHHIETAALRKRLRK